MMEHISSEARAAVEAEHCLREISEEMRSPVILAAAKIDARELQNQAAEAERRAEILAKRLAAAEESARLAKLKVHNSTEIYTLWQWPSSNCPVIQCPREGGPFVGVHACVCVSGGGGGRRGQFCCSYVFLRP